MEIKMSVEFVREAMFDYWLRGCFVACVARSTRCFAYEQVAKLPSCQFALFQMDRANLWQLLLLPLGAQQQLSSARLVFAFLARIDWKIVNIWHAILCILKDKSEKSTTPPGRVHREWQPEKPRLKWTMMMKRGKSPSGKWHAKLRQGRIERDSFCGKRLH